MAMTKQQILKAAKALDLNDRMDIADELFASVSPEEQRKIDKAWVVEVERRLDDLKSGRTKGIPADEALDQIRAKYRK